MHNQQYHENLPGRIRLALVAAIIMAALLFPCSFGGEKRVFAGSADTISAPGSPEALITLGESVEGGEIGDKFLAIGGGVEEDAAVGEYKPESDTAGRHGVKSLTTRQARRILKQDVYGKVLADSFYFHRNNLNKNEQALYDQIYANAFEASAYFQASTRVHYSRALHILLAVKNDHPDLFWLMPYVNYTYGGSGNITSITLSFYDAAVKNLAAYKQAFHSRVDSVLEVAMRLENDVEKVKFIHDLLSNMNEYIYANYYDQATMNQSAYSAVYMGKTVCAGYAAAFTFYMQRLGIHSFIVHGRAANEAHIWNIVQLYGDYYAMDVAWNNPRGNPPNRYYYTYFNVTDSFLSRTHRRDQFFTSLPAANGTKYSYQNFFGNRPGSDFRAISYGKPKSRLPGVYPQAQRRS